MNGDGWILGELVVNEGEEVDDDSNGDENNGKQDVTIEVCESLN